MLSKLEIDMDGDGDVDKADLARWHGRGRWACSQPMAPAVS